MFNSLSGTVTGKAEKQLFLDTHGIEWDICVPDSCLKNIANVGQNARIYTYLVHTENAMNLFGFASSFERSIFLDLLKVEGIGPKAAVRILSSVSSNELVQILETENLAVLEKIQGVGKKTASKMLLTLKGKLHLEETSGVEKVAVKQTKYSVVVSALLEMGYDKNLVLQAISEIETELKNDENFEKSSQQQKEDLIFKKVLGKL